MKKLEVRYRPAPGVDVPVGKLAEAGRRVYFEYDGAFIERGVQLSPFRLPLGAGIQEHADTAFGPLPGLFDDSLPDGWGLLLMDRGLQQRGLAPGAVTALDRLAYLGTRTMGALTYHPPAEAAAAPRTVRLAPLARNAEAVLEGRASSVLPALLRAGGSPGGARPKVTVALRGDHVVSGEDSIPDGYEAWLVKFAAPADAEWAGPLEYAYHLMAKAAGVAMSEARLFEVGDGPGLRRYFGTRRFDRGAGGRRVHTHTFGNLIHANFRVPCTDYLDLLKVTRLLTRRRSDLLAAFRLMAFNVATHNRDDHVKNFAFLLHDDEAPRPARWGLAPAYDLTFSRGPGGEHSMTVAGEGRAPEHAHCLEAARRSGVAPRDAQSILEAVDAATARWRAFASEAGCGAAATAEVERALKRVSR